MKRLLLALAIAVSSCAPLIAPPEPAVVVNVSKVVGPLEVQAAEPHYVRAGGVGSWANCAGDSTQACNLATANANAAAGNIVQLLNDTYSTKIAPVNDGASFSNRIIFQGNPTARSAVVVPPGSGPNGHSYITIRHMTQQGSTDINNAAGPNYGTTCRFDSTHHVTFKATGGNYRTRLSQNGAKDCVTDWCIFQADTGLNLPLDGRIQDDYLGSGNMPERDTVSNTIALLCSRPFAGAFLRVVDGLVVLNSRITVVYDSVQTGGTAIEMASFHRGKIVDSWIQLINRTGSEALWSMRDSLQNNVWLRDTLTATGSSVHMLFKSTGSYGHAGKGNRYQDCVIDNMTSNPYGWDWGSSYMQSDSIITCIIRGTSRAWAFAGVKETTDGGSPLTHTSIVKGNTFIGTPTGPRGSVVEAITPGCGQPTCPWNQPLVMTFNAFYSTTTVATDIYPACLSIDQPGAEYLPYLTSDYNYFAYYAFNDITGDRSVWANGARGSDKACTVGPGGQWPNFSGQDLHSVMAATRPSCTACRKGPAFKDSLTADIALVDSSFVPGLAPNIGGGFDTSGVCRIAPPVAGYAGARAGVCSGDATPPDSVHNFQVVLTAGQPFSFFGPAFVSWQSSGDDGQVGTAHHFKVRYANPLYQGSSDINDSNFDSLPEVSVADPRNVPPAPQVAGTYQGFWIYDPGSIMFGGVAFPTRFGIRVYDMAGNASHVAISDLIP